MPTVPIYRQDGSTCGEIELSEDIFGCEFRPGLVHEVVVAQRANKRQATSMTKTRSFVRGGGKKPWRQKGTGRARQGSIRAPQWVGGGRPFGGQHPNFRQDLPKKVRKGALRAVLSQKVREDSFKVVEDIQMESIKTKNFAAILSTLNLGKGTLLVHDGLCEAAYLSARNIPGVRLIRSADLSTLDTFEAKTLVLLQASVESLTKRLHD
jgi:large subunit ribosomal protein L4